MLFDIYYMKPEHFRRFIIGDEKPKVSELHETHTPVRRNLQANDHSSVWAVMQGEVWSPNGEARMLIEHLGLQHTSMSVGDVMHRTNTDQFFVVSNIGFTLLEDDRPRSGLGNLIDPQATIFGIVLAPAERLYIMNLLEQDIKNEKTWPGGTDHDKLKVEINETIDKLRSYEHIVLDPATFGKLIKKCAFEMNAFDSVECEKAQDEGRDILSTTDGPSVDGNRICQETAKGMGLEPFGELAYYLLAYVWNDALDWADRQTGAGYLADLSET